MYKKTAIVTGGSRGIGRGIAKKLSENGYNVIINYRESKDRALDLREEILASGGSAEIYCADVRNYDEVNMMVNYTKNKFGSIDLLVNNAGISQIKLFTEISVEDWNDMIGSNLNGIFNCSQLVAGGMIEKKRGKIINISSIWGITGSSCEVHYSTAKSAIIGFTKALAKELGPSNIQVNCIAPGIVLTDMMLGFTEEEMQDMKGEIPLERFGNVEEIGDLVCFLASDSGNYITGQVISPNGGMVI